MENKGIVRITNIISTVIMALAVIFMVLIWIKGDDQLTTNVKTQNSILDPFFILSYIALILGIILALAFPVANVIMNPKKAGRLILVLAAFIVIIIVAYLISPNTYSEIELETKGITASTSRWVGVGLIFTYVVGIIAIISAVYSGMSKFFK